MQQTPLPRLVALSIRGLMGAVLGSALTASATAAVPSEPAEDTIPLYTADLDVRLQPWCPKRCVDAIPFTATYHHGDQTLVFVAAHHDFREQSATKRAVAAGFEVVAPALVIVEGFPTAMGEDPTPLVEEARRRGTPQATEYSKGEGMYAASLALKRAVPFVGGEPTRKEVLQALKEAGFSERDVAFAYLAGALAQALRAKTLQDAADPAFPATFEVWARGFHDQYQLAPLSVDEFAAIYQETFGVDLRHDAHVSDRVEPRAPSWVGRLKQVEMHTRDVHLLSLIETSLRERKTVLIVYGGSHWSTLSSSLEQRLGPARIRVFTDAR